MAEITKEEQHWLRQHAGVLSEMRLLTPGQLRTLQRRLPDLGDALHDMAKAWEDFEEAVHAATVEESRRQQLQRNREAAAIICMEVNGVWHSFPQAETVAINQGRLWLTRRTSADENGIVRGMSAELVGEIIAVDADSPFLKECIPWTTPGTVVDWPAHHDEEPVHLNKHVSDTAKAVG